MQLFLALLFLTTLVGIFTPINLGVAYLCGMIVYAVCALFPDEALRVWDEIIFAGGLLMNPWLMNYFKPKNEDSVE